METLIFIELGNTIFVSYNERNIGQIKRFKFRVSQYGAKRFLPKSVLRLIANKLEELEKEENEIFEKTV